MEDAKKLLDSLMGNSRDVPLKEARKKRGQNFKESSTCKFYLLGFCPQYEDLFRNTKKGHLQIGDCDKIHSEALVEEFNAHPDKAEYERTYSRDLVRYLETLTRKVDDIVQRTTNEVRAANQDLEESGPNAVAKRQIQMIRENCSTLLNEAEELAEAGDVEGSKAKQALYEQTKEKAEEYEARSKEPMKEEVCDICGLRPEDGDGVRTFTHTQGRIHIGFVKIREWVKKLKERLDELQEERRTKMEEGRNKYDEEEERRKKTDDGAPPGNDDGKDRDRGDRDDNRRDERGTRRSGEGDNRGDDRGYERRGGDRDRGGRGYERKGGDRDFRGDERGYDRRGGDREYRGGGYDRRGGDRDYRGDDRGYDRRGDRDRGQDEGYGRGRSRSGGRRR